MVDQQFFLQFQLRHGTFASIAGAHTITIARLGGANPLWHVVNAVFANDKPMIGSVGDLYGDPNQAQQGAWLTTSAVGQRLVGNVTPLASDYTSDVTTFPLVFGNTRPLFNTDLLVDDNYSYSKVLANEPDVGQPGEALFDSINLI